MSEVHIEVESNRLVYSLDIHDKVTIIKGKSGSGKSKLVDMIEKTTSSVCKRVSNGFSLRALGHQEFDSLISSLMNDYVSEIRRSDFKTEEEYLKHERVFRSKFLRKKLKEKNKYFPERNSIIIADDEKFIASDEFSIYIDEDRYNYFIVIDRNTINGLNYSAGEIYRFKTHGKYHEMEKLDFETNQMDCNLVLVEGIGSDYSFFKESLNDVEVINPTYFNNIQNGGKTYVVSAVKDNIDFFKSRKTLLLIDYCGFGNCIEELIELIDENDLNIMIFDKYLSFEYFLLKSNLFESNIDEDLLLNNLKHSNKEHYCTQVLKNLTKDTNLSYSKKQFKKPSCYLDNCCVFNNSQSYKCFEHKLFDGKDKFLTIVKDTVFDFLNKYRSTSVLREKTDLPDNKESNKTLTEGMDVFRKN
jgi:hypothetical protein